MGDASSSKSAVRGRFEDGKGGEATVTRVSTMEDGARDRPSAGEGCRDAIAAAFGVESTAPSFVMTGVGEMGVSRRSSRGDSGEKEGKDVKDLSEAAIEEAELEGWEVSLALLLLTRTSVDLCELLDRKEVCEMERSSSSGDVDIDASVSMIRLVLRQSVLQTPTSSTLCCSAWSFFC